MGLGSGSGQLGCGGTCMKYILFIFNFVFFLSGAAILGVAIWIKVDPNINDYLEIINWDESNDFLSISSWILIGVGAFIFLVGFCGCCGACRESTCLLQTYAALMIIVLILEVVAAILAIVFTAELGDEIQGNMQKQAREQIKGNLDGERLKDPLTKAWDSLERNLECCGSFDYRDYENSTFVDESSQNELVPKSCCRYFRKGEDNPTAYATCNAEVNNDQTEQLYRIGCYQGLIDWMKDNSAVLIGVGFGLAALEILGIVFACCVASGIKEKY